MCGEGGGDMNDSSLSSFMAPASPHLSVQPSGHDEKEEANIILSNCQIWSGGVNEMDT